MTIPNVHPIIVHFPVALLTVYALAELARFKFVLAKPYVFYVKAVLVIVGALGAGAAYLSGDLVAEQIGETPLIETHSQWGIATAIIFGAIALSYAVLWIERERKPASQPTTVGAWPKLVRLAKMLVETPAAPVAALVGLACVTVTGALGGAIVYGPDIDPFVKVIYGLLIR